MNFTADFYKQAQDCIMSVFNEAKPKLLGMHGTVEPTIKDDSTPVTELDKEIEATLRKALLKFDPGIGLEGEELGKEGNGKTFWLIDPIDGTESFVRGLPFVRNMATLIDDGEPVFTIVYKPITEELYSARKGKGAYKNGKPIHVSSRPLSRAWIELSVPLHKPGVWEVISSVREKINGFRTIGDFTLVAEGKIDGHLVYKSGGGPWDYAPRALLSKEAGAKVANIGSPDYDYANFDILIANPVIFDDLKATIDSVVKS